MTAYPIDYITAEITGTDYKDDDSVAGDEITVTAYYYGADRSTLSSMPLTSDEYGVSLVSAEDGAVVGTVNVWTTIGTVKSTSVEVTVTPDPEDVVTGLASVAVKSASKLAPLAYTEDTLPEYTFDDTVVTGYVNDGTTANTLSGDPGITYTIVDENGLPLRSLDFTTKPTLKLLAEYDGVEYLSSNTITYGTATLSVVYEGEDYVKGETLPAIDPADFYVTLEINGKYEVLDDLPASAFVYYNSGKQYTGTTVPSAGGLAVNVTYMGLTSGDEITLVDKSAATVEDITFTMADTWSAPAKQYYLYNKVPTVSASDVKELQIAMSDGTTKKEAFNSSFYSVGLYLAEGEPVVAPVSGEYEALAAQDTILVGVTFSENGETYYSDPISLDADPAITTLKATANEDGATSMVGDTVEVVVVASNENGDVNKDFTAYTAVNADGEICEIDTTVGATDVVYTIYANDDVDVETTVTIYAGKGYFAPKGETVLLKRNATEMSEKVGAAIDLALVQKYFVVDTDSYDTYDGEGDETAPAITGVNVNDARKLVTGDNVIPVEITYVGSTGKTVVDTVNVTIVGTAYVDSTNPSFGLTYEGSPITELVAGKTYYLDQFNVAESSYKEMAKGDVVVEITGVARGDGNGEISGSSFVPNIYEGGYDFTVSYVNSSLADSTKVVHLDAKVAQN